ncbi:MAG: gliding motility-associated C-terminal domain-containing protein [Crocinitomicaceae bacterium]|nr:gliding motility-associated C-terminal domain-containing protein [Crocinitomicaceae bacterium]
MKIKTLLFLLVFFFSFQIKASHIVGGEIYYDSLGNNMYRVTIELFRDCLNSTTPFDNPIEYTVFLADGTIYSTFTIALPTPEILPIVYDDPCVTPPSDICIERAVYTQIITLPLNATGYYISYQRCCWANNIQNIVSPGDNGITLTTFVPGTGLVTLPNNAARFNDYPPLVLCANSTLNFDHAATDIDGDSLVYFLCPPLLGGSIANVIPDPETAAPYAPITWDVGFSNALPLGPGSSVTIDSETGMMAFTPSLLGNFAIGVCVQEYRNGIQINEKMRTFGYRVVSCNIQEPLEVSLVGPPNLIEDCGFSGFIVTRDDTTTNLAVQIFLSGNAINGVDYTFLPDTLILPQGVFTDTIGFTPLFDLLTEGTETVVFNIVIANPCNGSFDTTTTIVNIIDYIPLTISSLDSINVCAEIGESALIFCTVQNGVPPYAYTWTPNNAYPNNDSVIVQPSDLNPNLNVFTVNVLDQCGKSIQSLPIDVYNQCPLEAPNVLTLNNDGVNEFFLIENIDNYDAVKLQIFNRWGNLIFETEDYQNDWTGKTAGGTVVEEGVYFYTATPKSIKYVYDDQQKTEFTLHGFIHIIK